MEELAKMDKISEDAMSDREKQASIRLTAGKYGLSLRDASAADEVDRTLTSLAVDKTNLTPDEMADVAAKNGFAANKNILDKMASVTTPAAAPGGSSSPSVKVPLSIRRLRAKQ